MGRLAGTRPDLCASMIRGWLKAEGFGVRIETTTEAFLDPALKSLSLIIPIYTMSKIEKPEALRCVTQSRAASALPDIMAHVRRVPRQRRYQFMCGGQWVAHPATSSTTRSM